MKIIPHHSASGLIAEIVSEEEFIKTTDDGLQLLADLYYQEFVAILIHQKNLSPDFFNLKNGMAGELFQKFSNYKMRLGVVGDFFTNNSNSLHDFITESNRKGMIIFGTYRDVIARL